MESVTIKLETSIKNRINKTMKLKGYSTKTEFIREAIRTKLENDEKEKLIYEFMKYKGKSSNKTTYKDNKITREKVAEEIAKEFGL